jgi:hypothetical protein
MNPPSDEGQNGWHSMPAAWHPLYDQRYREIEIRASCCIFAAAPIYKRGLVHMNETSKGVAINGWQRIGIVLSIIWFFAFSIILWSSGSADRLELYEIRKSNCADTFNANNAIPRPSDGDYDKRSSENRNELRQCEQEAAAAFRRELRAARQNIPVLLANVIVTIVLAWGVVWSVTGIVRWVKRGFEF